MRSQDAKAFKKNSKEVTEKSVRSSFLPKLFKILEEQKHLSVISWSEDGNSFMLKNVNHFAKEILPKYFGHTKYASFIRQLSFYEFKRISKSFTRGHVYYHPSFCRGNIDLLKNIQRKSTRTTKPKATHEVNESNASQNSHIECHERNKNLLMQLKTAYETIEDLNRQNHHLKRFIAEDMLLKSRSFYVPQNQNKASWEPDTTMTKTNFEVFQESTTEESQIKATEVYENNQFYNQPINVFTKNFNYDRRNSRDSEYAFPIPNKLFHEIPSDYSSYYPNFPQANHSQSNQIYQKPQNDFTNNNTHQNNQSDKESIDRNSFSQDENLF